VGGIPEKSLDVLAPRVFTALEEEASKVEEGWVIRLAHSAQKTLGSKQGGPSEKGSAHGVLQEIFVVVVVGREGGEKKNFSHTAKRSTCLHTRRTEAAPWSQVSAISEVIVGSAPYKLAFPTTCWVKLSKVDANTAAPGNAF